MPIQTRTSKTSPGLADAIAAHVEPGMHLHFASTPSRANAAIVALAQRFRRRNPGFVLSTSGFHSIAHLMAMLRLGRKYIACFFGDNYPTPRPNRLYMDIAAEGAALETWPLLSYVESLRAGALGRAFGVVHASLAATDLGAALAAAGKLVTLADPDGGDATPLTLVRAMRPDITFLHVPVADAAGHLVASAPHCEGFWAAAGARAGTIVTAERVLPAGALAGHPERVPIPTHQVRAVCEVPFGAHPQSLYTSPGVPAAGYADDYEHFVLWRRLSQDAGAFAHFAAEVLDAGDTGAAYRAFAGMDRMRRLASAGTPDALDTPPAPPRPLRTRDRAIVERAAHAIAARALAGGIRVILAGIGLAFVAARQARDLLHARGHAVQVIVETGIIDLDCGPRADDFLLSHRNIALADRRSHVEDALGVLCCGAGNRCLAVLGAAEVDPRGNVNSMRLADGRFLVGPGGAADIAASAAEVVVLCARERLTERVAHITSPGHRVRCIVTEGFCLERPDARPDGWRRAADPAPGPAQAGEPMEVPAWWPQDHQRHGLAEGTPIRPQPVQPPA